MSGAPFNAPASGRFPLDEPYAGAEIAAAIGALHETSVAFLDELSDVEFLAPQGAFWSPADHVRHLRRSCRAVGTALAAPKVALKLRFGSRRGESRDLGGVVAAYHEKLAAGGSADGSPFAPEPAEVAAAEVPAWREGLVERWTAAVSGVVEGAARWSERALDGHQLPHPLLGKMSVREILLFTLYHNAHHVRRIAERASA